MCVFLLLLWTTGCYYYVHGTNAIMTNSVYSKNPHTIYDMKMTITEHIRYVDRAILNTFFDNTVRRVNKCLVTLAGGGHFEHYL